VTSGVASYGAPGRPPPFDFQLVIFEGSCTSDSHIDFYSNSTKKLTLCSVEGDLVQAADIDKIVAVDNRHIVPN